MIRLFLILAFFNFSAAKADEIKFGYEFTFTNDRILELAHLAKDPMGFVTEQDSFSEGEKHLIKFIDGLKKSCPNCQIQRIGVSFEIQTQISGIETKLVASLDEGVMEIKGTPVTVSEAKKIEAWFNKNIFDVAKSAGLLPHPFEGGGHIHMDSKTAFRSDPRRFLNFISDQFSHPEISSHYGMAENPNAPHFSDLDPAERAKFNFLKSDFEKRILDFEKLNLSEAKRIQEGEKLIGWISNEIVEKVYAAHPMRPPTDFLVQRYHAVNLLNLQNKFLNKPVKINTAELRYFNPQKSFSEFVDQISFLQNRVDYLVGNFKAAFLPFKEVISKKFLELKWGKLKQETDAAAQACQYLYRGLQ